MSGRALTLVAAPCDAMQSLLNGMPDTAALVDDGGTIVMVNTAWLAFGAANGGSPTELGTSYLEICVRAAPDPYAQAMHAGLCDVLEGRREAFGLVYPCHAPDRQRWVEARVARVEGARGRHAVVTHRDITVEHEARRSSDERAELLDAVGAAIVATDLEGRITHWTTGAEALFGWSAVEVLGRPVREIAGSCEGASGLQTPRGDETGGWEGRCEVRHREGHTVVTDVRSRPLVDGAGHCRGAVGAFVELTEAVVLEQRLRSAGAFLEAVTESMPDGLVVVDDAGCAVLANEAAEEILGWPRGALLREPLPPELVSIAGAELAHGTGVTRNADATFTCRDGTAIAVSYSSAAFHAEGGERHAVVVFNDVSERRAEELRVQRELEALTWVGKIRDALAHDRFVLYAQPIVDLATGVTVQHELLIRMVDDDGSIVPPGEFLPAAERYGLITDIDQWVFERAFAYAAQGMPVEVNVSAASLGDPRLTRHVEARMQAHGVDPSLVVFEITETALIDNEAAAEAFVERVRHLGSAVALDDFGTGYGSFRYLKHLPVSVLKIDQEFVRDLDGDDHDANRHVIDAIVSLSRGMGQRTVAEGVETASALEALRAAGVDCAQGYFLGRPAPADRTFASASPGEEHRAR